MIEGPFQYFVMLCVEHKVARNLCGRRGFGAGGMTSDVDGSESLLRGCILHERPKIVLRVRGQDIGCHATDALVENGQVREADKCGDDQSNTAADLERRRQRDLVRRSQRNLGCSCGDGILRFCIFITSFVAVSRVVLNQDGAGGTSRHPVVWSLEIGP